MKKQIRKEIILLRDSLEAEAARQKNHNIKQQLFGLPEFTESQTVSSYVSFRSEVETVGIIEECIRQNKRVLVPVIIPERRELVLSEIRSLDELEPGFWGILEPKKEFLRPVDRKSVDAVIVPGVAFDKAGYRIGYGGGYYDRLIPELPEKCIKISLAYELQIIDSVPREEHDMKIDIIVTENRIIRV